MTIKHLSSFIFLFVFASCGFHRPEVKILPDADKEPGKTLFVAIDGIGYEMMEELQKEGHFVGFRPVVPMVVPFPSATTIGFTGIFRPLNGGTVPGYESRFYSYRDNKIIGGTPGDIYKIKVNYKTYFDSFRHTMHEKGVMYTFPGMAGQQDLMRTEKLVMQSPKKILMTYLGGTDGAQHLLGRNRMKRFMIFVDLFLERMKKRYAKDHPEPLRIVLFSDHGFHFDRLKIVGTSKIKKALESVGLKRSKKLKDPGDVVVVEYGLLSSGVMITHEAEKGARAIRSIEGMDLIFWAGENTIHLLNTEGEEAYFEYQGTKRYRYVSVFGDPLNYQTILKKRGYRLGEWVSDDLWKNMTAQAYYPDVGYRLYDAFFRLVENRASVLFSLKPDYQFGGLAALAGTYLKFGHKGTHGALFRDTSLGMVMTDDPKIPLPKGMRYDELFPLFLPHVTGAYQN